MSDRPLTPREEAHEYWRNQPTPRVPEIGGIGQGLRVGLNDLLLVRIVCIAGAQVSYNVRHWLVSALSGQGVTLGELASQFDAMHSVHWPGCMGSNAAYLGTTVQVYRPEPPTAFAYCKDTVLGAQVGENLAKQTCGVVTLFTPLAGRSYRGRIYVPFPSESDNLTTGVPAAAYVTRLATLATGQTTGDDFPGATGSAALTPQLFHRKNPALPASFDSWTVITGFRANAKWGTQRRRGDYGQQNVAPFILPADVQSWVGEVVLPIEKMTGGTGRAGGGAYMLRRSTPHPPPAEGGLPANSGRPSSAHPADPPLGPS